jgi:hypothetical protein
LILVIILLALPKDPKNAWLFGYSPNRISVVVCVLFYLFAFIYIYRSISTNPKTLSKPLRTITSHRCIQGFIELFIGLLIILLFVGGYYFYHVVSTVQIQEDLLIRLIPIVVFIWGVILQILVVLVLLRRIFAEEKPDLRKGFLFRTITEIWCKTFNQVESIFTRIANRLNKSLLTGIFILTPAILTFSLIWILFRTTPLTFIPHKSDEINYWRETLTFVDHGFSGGQYSFLEKTAQAQFTRFGIHGPAFPVLYGLLGRIIGWEYYSGVLINLFLITLAMIVFLRLGKLDNKQLLCGIMLLGTYWPLLLYLPSNMTESLNQAIAIVISVLFFKQLFGQENNWKLNLAIFIILIISIPIRVTWSLLLFPFFIFMIFDYRGYKLWGAIICSVIGVLLSFITAKYLYAPFPMVFRSVLDGQLSFQELFTVAIGRVNLNLLNLIDEVDTRFYIQAFRYLMIGASIFLIYKLIRHFLSKGQSIKSLIRTELGFHFLNLVVPLIGVIVLFDVVDTRDYRNLSVSFLLSALVLLLCSRYRYIYSIILINGLLVFSFIPGYVRKRSPSFNYDQEVIEAFSNSVSDHLRFDETQHNRWCNTLGFNKKVNISFVVVDSGIGLTKIDDVSEDTKPRFLLLSDKYVAEFQTHIDSLGLEKLEETDLGVLYLNPNSGCE